MWRTDKEQGIGCTRAADCLEAAETSQAVRLDDLIAMLPIEVREHVSQCRECRDYCSVFIEARQFLAPLSQREDVVRPFFSKRVMAAIRAKEDEMERTLRAWAAVPRMASRLAAIAMLVLFLAGTWLYKAPTHKLPVTEASVESNNAIVEDNTPVPMSKDDVLVSVLEREQQ
jgi:predicted anti-sigma-YlaC factor YlaD